MSLSCPQCGSTEKFASNQWIEHHDAYFDSEGFYLEDLECYDAYHDTDGATCVCCECGHEGAWLDFED